MSVRRNSIARDSSYVCPSNIRMMPPWVCLCVCPSMLLNQPLLPRGRSGGVRQHAHTKHSNMYTRTQNHILIHRHHHRITYRHPSYHHHLQSAPPQTTYRTASILLETSLSHRNHEDPFRCLFTRSRNICVGVRPIGSSFKNMVRGGSGG